MNDTDWLTVYPVEFVSVKSVSITTHMNAKTVCKGWDFGKVGGLVSVT